MVTLPLLKFTQLDKQISYMFFFYTYPCSNKRKKHFVTNSVYTAYTLGLPLIFCNIIVAIHHEKSGRSKTFVHLNDAKQSHFKILG